MSNVVERHLNIFFNKGYFLEEIFFFKIKKFRFTGKSKIISSAINNFTKRIKNIEKERKKNIDEKKI